MASKSTTIHLKRSSKYSAWTLPGLLFISIGPVGTLLAQAPALPQINGISQIALFSHDYEKSRAYYGNFLGLQQLYPLRSFHSPKSIALFRINDRQYIELVPERSPLTDRLSHISLQTNDAEAMRVYLSSKGVVVPRRVHRSKLGILSFGVTDPEGHRVEMLQYLPHALILHTNEKRTQEKAISNRMAHVGLIVTSLPSEYSFYTDILGFKEIYRGSMSGTVLSWVNLKVPNGDDYIELMLYKQAPDPAHRGGPHHLCLQVEDVPSSVTELESRPYFLEYGHPISIRLGVNRKRQINLFDPDGTRLELMEPRTIDGKPVASSNAPPP